MKVKQFEGKKGPVKNQFLLTEEGRGANGNFVKKEIFQSYDSIIAIKTWWRDDILEDKLNLEVELDDMYWNYSTTTSKYRNMFLGETTEETKKKIASGEYKLTNLN